MPEASLRELEEVLHEMAPDAPILHSVHGEVDGRVLFPSLSSKSISTNEVRRRSELMLHTHEAFESQELSLPDDLTPDQLLNRLQAHQALRMKGIVHTSEGLKLVQGVGSRIELTTPPSGIPEDLIGRIIIICRK